MGRNRRAATAADEDAYASTRSRSRFPRRTVHPSKEESVALPCEPILRREAADGIARLHPAATGPL